MEGGRLVPQKGRLRSLEERRPHSSKSTGDPRRRDQLAALSASLPPRPRGLG